MESEEQKISIGMADSINAFVEDKNIEWIDLGEGVSRKVMSYDSRLMLVKVGFEQGAIGTVHRHYHTQISYVESGEFEVEVDGKKEILKAGDVFHAAPDLLHGVVCMEAGVLIDVFSPMREDFV